MSSIHSSPSSYRGNDTEPSGKILRLELHNFKSYRGHQVIGPFKQFSCVVGPNGSGKSNLMDAISFVMGLRAQYLRSSKLSKLIYHGEDGELDEAHVKLVFEEPNGDAVEFKRRVTKDGKTEYYLNDSSVTHAQYDERLQSYGILSRARNFLVFQGDVESIASKSPMELTKLIEKVSKSDEFKAEYDRLKAKKEATSELVVQNFQKKKSVNQERTKYKLHKKEAQEFDRLSKEHTKKQSIYALWRLYHIEAKIQSTVSQMQRLESTADSHTDEIHSLQDDLAQQKKQLAKLRMNLVKREQAYKKRMKSHRKIKTENDQIQLNLKHAQSAIERLERQISETVQSNEKHQREIQSLQADIGNAEKQKQAEIDEVEESYGSEERDELSDAQKEEYNKLKLEVGKQTINLQESLNRNRTVLESERQEVKDITNRLQLTSEKLENLERVTQGKQDRFDKRAALYDSNKKDKENLEQEMKEIQEKRNELEDEQNSNRQELEKLRDEIRDARVEEDENKRDAKMSQALESMKNHFSGVYGKMTDLFEVSSKRYEIPVHVAMGGRNRNAIITDTEKTAIECIKYLKEQRVPPMLFVPLDTIQPPKLKESLRNLHNTDSKLVMDVVSVRNPQFEPALRYALGNTVLLRDMDSVMRITHEHKEKVKCVTEDGTLFTKSGFITGGRAEVEEALKQAGSQKTRSKSDVAQLKSRRDELITRLSEITQDALKLEQREKNIANDVQSRFYILENLEADRNAAQKELDDVRSQEEQLRATHDKDKKELDEASKRLQDVEAATKEQSEKIAEIEDKILADFNNQIGYNMREYEEQRQEMKQRLSSIDAKYNGILSRLKESLEYYKSLFKDSDAINRLKQDLDQQKKEEKKFTKELKEKTKELGSSEKKIEELRDNVKDARKEIENQNVKANETIKSVRDKQTEIQTLQKRITNASGTINILRSKRQQLTTQCTVEEIEIPTIDNTERPRKRRRSSGATTPEGKIERSEPFQIQITEEEEDLMEDIEEAQSRKRAEREKSMCIDFSSLDEDICNVTSQEQYEKIEAEFKREIQRLDQEIDKLAPSLKTSKRYEGVKERFTRTADELDKAKEDSRKATQEFEAVKDKRYKRFMDAFKPISKAIDGIYKELTKSEAVPLGGTAYLGLDQEDEPYLQGVKYNAMPPLKRYRDIDQLSGGERTVAALALLFAIHRYRPSPFFILDEVDAALDNVNVNKVAHYIHRAAQKEECQFVVISLKESFFSTCDSLVGVCKDQPEQSSKTLSMDLTPFASERMVTSLPTPSESESEKGSEKSGRSGAESKASSGGVSDI